MSSLTLWLGQKLLTATAVDIYRRCIDRGLIGRCESRAEEWRKQLPEEAGLLSIAMFFRTDSIYGLENLPPGPTQILAAIERGEVPTAQMWLEDLLTQWEWVGANQEEPQHFFTLTDAQARAHLMSLATRLHLECVADQLLFQKDTHKTVHNLEEEIRGLRRVVENLAAVPAFASAEVAIAVEGKPTSCFHADIESACLHIKQGHPKLAVAVLEKLEKEHWSQLTPHERYRLVANRGIARTEMGELKSAARDFIACVQYEPNEEKPRCWAANGSLMLGNRPECARLVQAILADYPESSFAYALLVYSIADEVAFPEVETLIPERHRSDPDVAMALSERAVAGRLMEIAESYAKQACDCDSPPPKAESHLGSLIIESTVQQTRPLLSESPPVDKDRLREGIQILKKCLSAFEDRGDKASQASCHFHLGRAYHFIGKDSLDKGESSAAELKAAYTTVPSEPRFCTQYALALYDDGHEEDAIAILEKASAIDSTLNAAVLAAQLLHNRNQSGDIERAVRIVDAAQQHFPGEFPSANAEYVSILVDIYCAADKKLDAISTVDRLMESFGLVEKQSLLALTARKTDDIELAQARIRSAIDAMTDQTDVWTRHLIARELLSLRQFPDAFNILQQHVTDKCMSLDTRGLVWAAQECEYDGFLIGYLQRLREAGVVEPHFIDVELGLLERYHAGSKSIEIIQRLLEVAAGNEKFVAELRVRLSFLGSVYGRLELVESDLSRLPLADSARPEIGFLVVQLLIQQDEFEKARTYAYTLLRSNFSSKQAHQALIGAYLLQRGAGNLSVPDTVSPGTGFYYSEEGVAGERFAVIEDEGAPSIERHEYEVDHHVFANAIGKRVGDRFVVRDSGFQRAEGTILSILDKKVLRFNVCVQEYDRHFNDGFLFQVRLPKDAQGNLDLEPIRKATKRRAEEIAQRDAIYRSYPLSVSSYAKLSNANVVDVIGHMANERLPIRVCAGTQEEETLGMATLEGDPTLVLDASAVATFVHTDASNLIRDMPAKLLIPRGLVIRLKAEIENVKRFAGDATLSYIDSRLVFEEITEDQKATWIDRLRDTVDALEAIGEVVDGLALADELPQARNDWAELFGWDTAEALAIAKQRDATIWTDDRLVAQVATTEVGIRRVWTELTCKWGVSRNVVPYDRYVTIVAKLVTLGYWHTKLFPDAAMNMANDSDWNFQRAPFKYVIEWMGSAGVSAEAIGALAEVLLPRVYGGQSELISSATVQSILGSINKRRDGYEIIAELRRRVGKFCKFNILVEHRLKQDLEVWLHPHRLD